MKYILGSKTSAMACGFPRPGHNSRLTTWQCRVMAKWRPNLRLNGSSRISGARLASAPQHAGWTQLPLIDEYVGCLEGQSASDLFLFCVIGVLYAPKDQTAAVAGDGQRCLSDHNPTLIA